MNYLLINVENSRFGHTKIAFFYLLSTTNLIAELCPFELYNSNTTCCELHNEFRK